MRPFPYLLLLGRIGVALAWDNGLGLTPPMGWNPWIFFKCEINETLIRDSADALVSTGLRDLGYNYVIVDDCWAFNETRSPTGELLPDPIRFSSGIDKLADYIHSLGLKFGIYSNAGSLTCRGQPGSLYHEVTDANTFASWGVDYLKYDNCHTERVSSPDRFVAMRDALNATGKAIFYNLCNWGTDDANAWAPGISNSWRTSWAAQDNFGTMQHNIKLNDMYPEVAGPGAWCDPDDMTIGIGGMTDYEYRSLFTMWTLVKAPLIIGSDLTNITAETLTILSNTELIAINQDPLGIQGTCRMYCKMNDKSTKPEIWAVPLADGGIAVVPVNWRDHVTPEFMVTLGYLGLFEKYTVRDMWEHRDLGEVQDSLLVPSLPPHNTLAYRLTPVPTVVNT